MHKFLGYLTGLLFLGGIGVSVIALQNGDMKAVTWGVILIAAAVVMLLIAYCVHQASVDEIQKMMKEEYQKKQDDRNAPKN